MKSNLMQITPFSIHARKILLGEPIGYIIRYQILRCCVMNAIIIISLFKVDTV